MRTLIRVFLGIVFISLLSACSGGSKLSEIDDVVIHKNLSSDAYQRNIPLVMANASKGIGLYPKNAVFPPADENRPQNVEFAVENGQDFNCYLTLTNGRTDPRTVLVTVLIDYKQTFSIVDSQPGLLHEFTIPPNSQIFLPLNLNIQLPGAHDLIVVYFDDPYNESLDLDYRMDLFGRTLAFRAVVITAGNENPIIADSFTVTGNPIPNNVTFTQNLYFASMPTIGEEHPSHRQLYIGESKPSAIFPFQIVINNVEKTADVNYMLVAFLNYHQVPVKNKDSLLANLKPGNEAILNMSLTMPKEADVSLFQMIRLYDPYKSVLDKEVYTPLVFSSPRIAIVTDK